MVGRGRDDDPSRLPWRTATARPSPSASAPVVTVRRQVGAGAAASGTGFVTCDRDHELLGHRTGTAHTDAGVPLGLRAVVRDGGLQGGFAARDRSGGAR